LNSTKPPCWQPFAAAQAGSIVYLAYPNNPTANLWDDAVIEKIIDCLAGQRRAAWS
jgi:histidinol-phosphate/aromatic aminotransferase/cobyric acid decarboxylase-like protein